MTTRQLIARLQEIVAAEPEQADREVLIRVCWHATDLRKKNGFRTETAWARLSNACNGGLSFSGPNFGTRYLELDATKINPFREPASAHSEERPQGFLNYVPAHFNVNANCTIPAAYTVDVYVGDRKVLQTRGRNKFDALQAAREEYPQLVVWNTKNR